MARYQPIDMVKHYQGKICMHSDTYFQKRRRALCTGKICHPRDLDTKPYSQAELDRMDKFKQARLAMAALTSEQISAYQTDFEKQLKSPNPKYFYLQGFIFAQEYAKLN